MRRALLVIAVAVPAVVLAAVTAGIGKVVEVDNFSATANASYINAARCAGTENLRVEWNIQPVTGGFTPVGNYLIFASDQAPPTSGDAGVANFCAEAPNPNATPPVKAGPVAPTSSFAVRNQLQQEQISGAGIVAVTGATCTTASEGKEVWVCSHWNNGSTAKAGYAWGKFIVQVAAPAAPVLTGVGVGEGSLEASWDPGTGGATTADRYVAEATPVDATGQPLPGSTPISSGEVTASRATISGLTNGQPYSVVVYALSVGRNRSIASNAIIQSPSFVEDFWEAYSREGREQGGCGAGGAGPAGLLAVAGLLLALRRRK